METELKSNKIDLIKTEIVRIEEKIVYLKKQPKRFSTWSFRNFWKYLKENTTVRPYSPYDTSDYLNWNTNPAYKSLSSNIYHIHY